MRRIFCLRLATLGLLLTETCQVVQRSNVCAAEEGRPKSVIHEVLDERVYLALLKVHKEAAGLYNAGEHAKAYLLFRGALLAVQPLLDHHPGYKHAIDVRFDQANREKTMDSRAWRLYECVADLEDLLGPKLPPPLADGKTLW